MTVLRRLFPVLIAGVLSAPAFAQPAAKAPASGNLINIPFETYKLPNGLSVILSVDRSIPQAAVEV